MSDLTLVCGAGGFIGGHLVGELLRTGRSAVRGVDLKPIDEWHQAWSGADNRQLDLRDRDACRTAVEGASIVYNLAADMGGMGFIERHRAHCMLNVLINTHLLEAARDAQVERFFFASSACVYAAGKQASADVVPLKEEDAYPAMPEDGYGWEKLFSERMCRHFSEDFGLATRVGRYHNVYGPHGLFDGGREKAPAAICRKVVQAKLDGARSIDVWGDGTQTRSFTYIDDCIVGTLSLAASGVQEPLNIGSSELVSIDRLVDLVAEIAGVRLEKIYQPDAPRGVNGRNSDNTRIRALLGWEPSTPLKLGLERTYRWIHDRMVGPTKSSRAR